MTKQFRTARREIIVDSALPAIHTPSDDGFKRISEALSKAKIILSEHQKAELKERFVFHAGLAETMRLDQHGRARPRDYVKKFRQQAIQFRNAAIFIDRFDTIQPGWPKRNEPPSLRWEVVEPEGLEILSAVAASQLGQILNRQFVTRGERVVISGIAEASDSKSEVEQRIKANPGRVLRELLLVLSKTYATVANELAASTPGGPKHHRVVPALVTWLAEDFHRLGRQPGRGRTGPFRKFADASFEAMGLPSNLIDNYIGKSVQAWEENLTDNPDQKTSS